MTITKEDFNTVVKNKFETPVHPACSPQSRQKERDEIAQQMAEWEAKNGPVVTLPITDYVEPKKTINYCRKSKG